MNKNEILDNLQQVVSKEPTKWHEDSEFRTNNNWLKHSQALALKVLRIIRDRGLSQKELAERMNVSAQQVNKWLKGKENFTFETVSKLEEALNMELITITDYISDQYKDINIDHVRNFVQPPTTNTKLNDYLLPSHNVGHYVNDDENLGYEVNDK